MDWTTFTVIVIWILLFRLIFWLALHPKRKSCDYSWTCPRCTDDRSFYITSNRKVWVDQTKADHIRMHHYKETQQ